MYITFENLVGETFDFYGAFNNMFKLGNCLAEVVFEAVEDEDDGYRSRLEELKVIPNDSPQAIGFYDTPFCKVKVVGEGGYMDGADIYRLIDIEDGHVWLEVGTDHSDSWYPLFIFNYSPKGV